MDFMVVHEPIQTCTSGLLSFYQKQISIYDCLLVTYLIGAVVQELFILVDINNPADPL